MRKMAELSDSQVMEEKPGDSFIKRNLIMYPVEMNVRLDWETLSMLDKIALFEREKRATMARRIIVEKVQVYERNPAFKRFLKQLEQQKKQR